MSLQVIFFILYSKETETPHGTLTDKNIDDTNVVHVACIIHV